MKILLIAGHGNGDIGATGNGYKEADLTRELVKLIAPKLMNYTTVEIADTSKNWKQYICNNGNYFNFKDYDYVLEIHFNACVNDTKGDGKTTGTEIYVTTQENGTSVEQNIINNISTLGLKNRGVKKYNYSLINYIKKQGVSAALLETCFIDDNDDMAIYTAKKDKIADAIVNGIVRGFNLKKENIKEENTVARTVMTMPSEMYIQEINPRDFEIKVCDKPKKNISEPNYFNCGFFTFEGSGKTISVGNLASDGKIMSQSKDQGDWINVAKKKLTTIYTTTDGKCGLLKTDNLSEIKNLKTAVSGIPIIVNARYVPENDIKAEGYFGTDKEKGELYDAWHGFLGIRHNKLVYVAMKCNFDKMCWALVGLGIYDAIKLDGGGSFILKNGEIIKATDENRRIHNIGIWNG